jgi:hypothetical protein
MFCIKRNFLIVNEENRNFMKADGFSKFDFRNSGRNLVLQTFKPDRLHPIGLKLIGTDIF